MKRITFHVLFVTLVILCFGSLQPTSANNKPNLYVLSIGATPPNIKYTEEDADDIIEVFNEQKGIDNSLYNEIITIKLTGEDATANDILTSIQNMTYGQDITPNDVFILFIASHGYRVRGKFYIQGSDFDSRIPFRTSVSLDEMMKCLNDLKAKKLIFLDACESGKRKEGEEIQHIGFKKPQQLADYIVRLMKAKPGYAMITSSSGDSAWNEKWENGVLTEALIKGLVNGEADSGDRDGVITLVEIYDYLREEVPALCQKEEDIPLQHPDCIRYDYRRDLPFYSVNPDNVVEDKENKPSEENARGFNLKGLNHYMAYSIKIEDDKPKKIFRWEQESIPLFYDNDRNGNRYFEGSAAFMGEGKRLGLRFEIKIDGDALNVFGTISENNSIIIRLDKNKEIVLHSYQYNAVYNYDTGQTEYNMVFDIYPEDRKRLYRNTITDVIIGWTPGRAYYQIMQPDGLIRQLNNIKRAQDDKLIGKNRI